MVEDLLARGVRPVCLGPLIHNPQMVARLKRKGLVVAAGLHEVDTGPVVIRSHGAQPEVFHRLAQCGIEVVDATCPFVRRVEDRARQLTEQGYRVIIVGEPEHPEVRALLGYAPRAVVAPTPDELRGKRLGRRLGVIAQTTQTRTALTDVLTYLARRAFSELKVFDTVCKATVTRLRKATRVARWAEVMFILGGHNSANTQRLARVCAKVCPRTFHLESAAELDQRALAGLSRAGVAAGASTPDFVVNELVRKLRR